MSTALVTIVIGEAYQALFDRYARARFEAYAARHGYAARIIDRPLLALPGKKFTWQKLCLPAWPEYGAFDRLAVLDSDILIARDAPPLPEVPEGKVALVADKPAPNLPRQYNSGVLLYRPGAAVTAFFAEARLDPEPYWDQWALTRVLLAHGADQALDRRFNRLVYLRCRSLPGTLLRRHWFYHALGGKSKLALAERLLQWQRR